MHLIKSNDNLLPGRWPAIFPSQSEFNSVLFSKIYDQPNGIDRQNSENILI
jgi:hypothetical protein